MADENKRFSSTFEGILDRYNGVTVDSSQEASTISIEEFTVKLDGIVMFGKFCTFYSIVCKF